MNADDIRLGTTYRCVGGWQRTVLKISTDDPRYDCPVVFYLCVRGNRKSNAFGPLPWFAQAAVEVVSPEPQIVIAGSDLSRLRKT